MKVAALAIVGLALSGCAATAGPPSLVTAGSAAAEKPVRGELYLGVDCRETETIACDKVALAVRLTKRAEEVTVTIADRRRRIEPMDFREGGPTRWWQTRFGELDLESPPFEIEAASDGTWSGRPAVRVPVNLSVEYADGRQAEQLRVTRLSPVYCG